jgi:hypothetical protein
MDCSHGWSAAQPVERIVHNAAPEGQRKVRKPPPASCFPCPAGARQDFTYHGFRCASPVATVRGPPGRRKRATSTKTAMPCLIGKSGVAHQEGGRVSLRKRVSCPDAIDMQYRREGKSRPVGLRDRDGAHRAWRDVLVGVGKPVGGAVDYRGVVSGCGSIRDFRGASGMVRGEGDGDQDTDVRHGYKSDHATQCGAALLGRGFFGFRCVGRLVGPSLSLSDSTAIGAAGAILICKSGYQNFITPQGNPSSAATGSRRLPFKYFTSAGASTQTPAAVQPELLPTSTKKALG